MDPNWINISAGVITVITGFITIINALKPKAKTDSSSTSTSGRDGKANNAASAANPKVITAPSPLAPGVQEFSGDDKKYQEWIATHPQGFVVNTNQGINAAYMALHKASCGHVSNFNSREPGAFTEGGYMKVCSVDLERLREWAKAHGRTDGSFTGNCRCVTA